MAGSANNGRHSGTFCPSPTHKAPAPTQPLPERDRRSGIYPTISTLHETIPTSRSAEPATLPYEYSPPIIKTGHHSNIPTVDYLAGYSTMLNGVVEQDGSSRKVIKCDGGTFDRVSDYDVARKMVEERVLRSRQKLFALLKALRENGVEYPYDGAKFAIVANEKIMGDPSARRDVFNGFGEFLLKVNAEILELSATPNQNGFVGLTTGTDVGTTEADWQNLIKDNPTVVNLIAGIDDPRFGFGTAEETTADGLIIAMELMSKRVLSHGLGGSTIAVQGIGNIGRHLISKLIRKYNVRVVAADLEDKNCDFAGSLGARIVSPEALYKEKVDIWSPNAGAGLLDSGTMCPTNSRLILGAANFVLDPTIALKTDIYYYKQLGITYVPTRISGLGGMLHAVWERENRGRFIAEWEDYQNQLRSAGENARIITKINSNYVKKCRQRREEMQTILKRVITNYLTGYWHLAQTDGSTIGMQMERHFIRSGV